MSKGSELCFKDIEEATRSRASAAARRAGLVPEAIRSSGLDVGRLFQGTEVYANNIIFKAIYYEIQIGL